MQREVVCVCVCVCVRFQEEEGWLLVSELAAPLLRTNSIKKYQWKGRGTALSLAISFSPPSLSISLSDGSDLEAQDEEDDHYACRG